MPKLKKKLTGNFTIINNTVLRDKRMDCTERGAYVTLVSMADDWNFSIRGLAAIMPEVVKSNIEYDDYALLAEDSDGYMTVEELDEIVQMADRSFLVKSSSRLCSRLTGYALKMRSSR